MHCQFLSVFGNSDAIVILSLSKYYLFNRIVLLGMHGLHFLFSFVLELFWSRQLQFSACANILDQLDCFFRNAWFVLSVLFRNWKFLLKAVGILSLSKCSLTIGLFCVRHTWFALSVFFCGKIFCPRQLEFLACANMFDQVRPAWFTLTIFFHDGHFLLEAVEILSLTKYSWSVRFFC